MALTLAQRAHIREILGWQSLFLQSGPGNRVESAMTAIAAIPDSETTITATLTKITALDVRIEGAYDRLRASVVGSITLNPGEISALKAEARRLCRVVAALLGVEIPNCKYGGGGVGGEVMQG